MSIQNKLIIHQKLLDWFKRNHRKLIFRETKNPYHIWVSEVMLQQTRVNAMLVSYEKFIKKFPDISSLANSNLETVLAYWKGLGYYSRAENLYKGARYVMENLEGEIPKDLEKILQIPGIGKYTASAILSISYNLPVAVLDGNVKRVLSRLFLFQGDIKKASSEKYLQNLANEFLNPENAGDHNQALMELGALICIPKPNCVSCPISAFCLACSQDLQNQIPISKKEKEKLFIRLNFLWIEWNGEVLLTLDNERRFFKKIYALPFWIEGKNLSKDYLYKEKIFSLLEVPPKPIAVLPNKHSITHHDIEVLVYKSRLEKLNFLKLENTKWIPVSELEFEFPSSLAKKILKSLNSSQNLFFQ